VAAVAALASSLALGALGIPFGLLVAGFLLAWPAERARPVSPSRPTVVAGGAAAASYVALVVLFGPLVFRGLVTDQFLAALVALAVVAAIPLMCVTVMSDAATESTRPLVLTRRNLVLAVAVVVAVTFAHGSGASFVVIAVIVLVLPIIGVARFALDPDRRRLARPPERGRAAKDADRASSSIDTAPHEPKPHPKCDVLVGAPMTANSVAKLALGIADNRR
jgi:Flavoprotein